MRAPAHDAATREPARLRRTSVVALVIAVLLAGGGALRADPETARFLLKGAKEDVAQKKYEAATKKLDRAATEDPTLLEVLYWQGAVAEALGDTKNAVASYRLFASRVAARMGAASKEESALRKRAEERVEQLAVGQAERRRLDEAFVGSMLEFARTNAAKDPVSTARALKMVLSVRPDHVEARRLLEKLGVPAAGPAAPAERPAAPASKPDAPDPAPTPAPTPAAAPAAAPAGGVPPPMKSIKAWRDLIAEGFFGDNPGWKYARGSISMDVAGGALTRSTSASPTAPKFAFEIECRLSKVHDMNARIGIGFGAKFGTSISAYTVTITPTELVLHRAAGEEKTEVLRAALEGADGDWHRFGVVVRGKAIEVWLDGKRAGEHRANERENLDGDLCVAQQASKADVRLLRWGRLP